MGETGVSRAAEVRAKLDHPMIDGDSHSVEFTPVFLDFLKEAGGSDAVQRFGGAGRSGRKNWYQMTWEERRQRRAMRPPWWALPTKNTLVPPRWSGNARHQRATPPCTLGLLALGRCRRRPRGTSATTPGFCA